MSTVAVSSIAAAKGGSFLIENHQPAEVFTPEDLSSEQRQIAAKSAAQFARDEVLVLADAIEAKQPGVMRGLLAKTAELGFSSVEIPEDYGGMGMDKVSSTVVTDQIAVLASFSTAFGAQAGIGTLPLVWYGTEEQKRKYLPKLASGEWMAAYALSEAQFRLRCGEYPHAGHVVGRWEPIRAQRRKDVDHQLRFRRSVHGVRKDRRRAVLGVPGGAHVSGGEDQAEEHKLGIRGSSTCPLVLDNCQVPAGNLLGEPGKGHHIAFNVLNMGRLKLGVVV